MSESARPLVFQATTGRLYPTARQARSMARIGGQCRALWNHWLAVNVARYAAEGKFAFLAEMSRGVTELRKEERFSGLPRRCADMTVKNLDRALRDCARGKADRKGFPKFKRQSDRRDAFQFIGREVRVESGRVRVPVLGWMRCRGLVKVPAGAKITTATARQERGGWSLSLQFEAPPAIRPAPTHPAVGIDLGLASLITLSTGEKVEPPRFAAKVAKRLRMLERQKARRRKGSCNRARTVQRLNREHARLAARRRDFAHKLSRAVVDRHEGVAVEKLRLRGLCRTRLAKSFTDAGIGELVRQLRYKAEWAGREFREFPTFERSTGICPACGVVGDRLPLSVRAWRCTGCRAMHDRDVAAAQVILLGAVPRVAGKLAGNSRRKRGAAVRRGLVASAAGSGGGSPANASEASCRRNPACLGSDYSRNLPVCWPVADSWGEKK